MPYDSRAVANYFLALGKRDGQCIEPMKIQKLVYFAHGWNLAIFSEPLIEDKIEAWRWGPVIPALYHSFKEFGSGPITRAAVDWNWDHFVEPSIDRKEEGAKRSISLIERIWLEYGRFTGIKLSNMTHEPGTPWDQTWFKEPGRKGVDIDDATIKDYFTRELNG
jgi:uncharacterized phage-associated protein